MKPAYLIFALSLAALAQQAPRAEYPQPQFQRETWLTLNGQWEFEFDDANAGLKEDWVSGKRKFGRAITVPFCFESPKSGIGDPSFHPWVWYRRNVTLPEAWKGRRVLLHFGAVDYRAMVWVNGRLAGSHEGGSTPFRFDATHLLQPGANSITVRAEDPPTDRTIPRGKQFWEVKSRGIFYTRTTGIWQSVWMEAAGDTWLDRVRITPSSGGLVRFQAVLQNARPETELHVSILDGDKRVSSGSVRASGSTAHLELQVSNPRQWFIRQGNLYDVLFEVKEGANVQDRVRSYFGFRTVTVESGRVFLNGRPVYLKMVLDQGYWPESLLTPPSEEAIQFDIEETMKMGFNGAWKHQKVEDPRFLYWADKLGYLVSGEMANAYDFTEDYAARFTREWMEVVERDYNHPSVIMWVPINESWGTPDLRSFQQQHHLKANYMLTKSLDPTRPVIDNDGWEHVDTTDLFALHDYARTGDLLYAKYKDAGKPGEPIPPNGRAALVAGHAYNGTPILLSEFGGIAYIPPGAKVPGDAWGYSGVEKTPEAAIDRLRGLYEAIAKMPQIVGICYTQLTDVEQEVNGLFTYDRKPKFDAEAVRRLNDLLR